MADTSGIAGRIARGFINSKLTPLLMAAFLGIGLYSAWITPKEEDPQIDVPMVDVSVRYPGATPQEVERRVAAPIERLASNIEGVEYVYATALPGRAMVSVRYYVGEDPEGSMVKLYEELLKHMDRMPERASMPLIKSRAVDDIPILTLALHSETTGDYKLRRIGQEMAADFKTTDGVADVEVHGGRARQIRVTLDPNQVAAYQLDPTSIARQLRAANQQTDAGAFEQNDTEHLVETGGFLTSVEEVRNLVVGVHEGRPVYLRQVAEVTDGPSEPSRYVSFAYGEGTPRPDSVATTGMRSAVTVSIAKRDGRDAMTIAERSLDRLETLERTLVPEEVTVTTTRNYGETASEKVSELLLHLLAAIVAVTLVVSLAMGWRGGLVVFLSVPISFALTLFVYYFFGYTLNRITLFALIFVTGIVVDDSIIVAENIERHFQMARLPKLQSALAAVDEVGNPTILATLTVIAAVLPMAFVTGLMGPYMSPMPIGASVAMLFSLVVALVIAPYLAYRLIPTRGEASGTERERPTEPPEQPEEDAEYQLEETLTYRMYSATIEPLLDSSWRRWAFIGGTTVLLLGSVSLFYFRAVTVKMLPFDDKDEFQVVVDMPEGTTLERTHAVLREMSAYLTEQPVVTNVQTYAGDAAPVNLNGLVRHYDLRSAPHQGDLQVNLRAAEHRDAQSHAIATHMREPLQEIGDRHDANVKIAEVPPGPPVRSTLVAEIYGPDPATQRALADSVRHAFEATAGIVDVDWRVEADQAKYVFDVDKEKAMRAGVPTVRITETMHMALGGQDVTTLHRPNERDPVGVHLRLGQSHRSSPAQLQNVHVQSPAGSTIPVADLVTVEETTRDKHIDRKNQQRVIYVLGDVAGEIESPVYAMIDLQDRLDAIKAPSGYSFDQLYTDQPEVRSDYALKWDGEWRITYKVFRDLGLAFAVVLLLIYILIVGWFQDLTVPLVMMIAIPLSLIGIVLGHWLLGAFFTATSMIGFIALAGIMVRNSVLLIDFANLRLDDGASLRTAVVEAGAVRTRPILLTAGTVVIAATVILFDPIFQGLAISLMGGAIASTALTLLIVPLVYYMIERRLAGSAMTGNVPSSEGPDDPASGADAS